MYGDVKITLTAPEKDMMLYALLQVFPIGSIHLVERIHKSDPANDGPEVEILRPEESAT